VSISPGLFPVVVSQLKKHGLAESSEGWRRVVIEKPFGHDLTSAEELNRIVGEVFPRRSVFRIDHYLGKETVQNLLVFRFANSLFEPIWHREHVDHVQITVAEEIGVEGRGKFYEQTGVTKDIVENHLMQLLCLTAMEPPISLSADAVRDEKV
jgi:glucose-6-phosphate 1-dehydrogenase